MRSVGDSPQNVQVSPDGAVAWVTNDGTREAEAKHEGMSSGEHDDMARRGEIRGIDTATDAVVAKVQVGKHPPHVGLGPGESDERDEAANDWFFWLKRSCGVRPGSTGDGYREQMVLAERG